MLRENARIRIVKSRLWTGKLKNAHVGSWVMDQETQSVLYVTNHIDLH